MDMRLISKKYHRTETENLLSEWWILTFKCGKDKVQKCVDQEDYDENDWIDGASYKVITINPKDVIEETVSKGKQLKLGVYKRK